MRHVALLSATLISVAAPLNAQRASILIGGVRAQYADSISGTAGFVAGRVSGSSSQAAGSIEVSFSQFTTGQWVTQVGGSGSAVVPLGHTALIGVRAGGYADTFEGGGWTGGATVGPILALTPPDILATVSVLGGRVRRTDASSLTTGTADARLRYAPGRTLAVEAGLSGTLADTIRYADVTLSTTWRRTTFLVSAHAGVRAGDLADDPWGTVRAAVALTPTTILEGAVGRYPQDLSGFTEGLYATLGMRLNLTQPARAEWVQPSPPLRVERTDEGVVRITVTFDHTGDDLELIGDWTGWTPLPMTRETSRRWSIEQPLPPGVYHYSLLVDGDTWTLPENATWVPDDLGGRVGILIVH